MTLISLETSYVSVAGSRSYGAETEDSDWDFVGFCVPPAGIVFPHVLGNIPLFGTQKKHFKNLQSHGIPSNKYGDVDLTIYNIVYYMDRTADGNPNMMDSLFVPDDAVLVMDNVGQMVRDNKDLFVSQQMYNKFIGMAKSHLNKITSRKRKGKRKALVEKYGYDVKDASHVVRVLMEIKSFMLHGDVDLTASKIAVHGIRNGEWGIEDIQKYFDYAVSHLDKMQEDGMFIVPEKPRWDEVKSLLLDCLEETYGSLTKIGWNIYA